MDTKFYLTNQCNEPHNILTLLSLETCIASSSSQHSAGKYLLSVIPLSFWVVIRGEGRLC